MLRLIESSIASMAHRLVLVAPRETSCFPGFTNVVTDTERRRQRIREMQRVRGAIYVDEGNVQSHELTTDGRHHTAEDDASWHLLMTDEDGHVRSCGLYLLHENATAVHTLRVRDCPLMQQPESRHRVTSAVESELDRARRAGLRFAELGGWAISKERRGSPDGLMMTMAFYGLSRLLGGALCLTTANVAHSCSSILRRMGGSYLEFEATAIPSYFDPRYNAEIDLLRFDSRSPSPKYAPLLALVMASLPHVLVVGRSVHSARARPRARAACVA